MAVSPGVVMASARCADGALERLLDRSRRDRAAPRTTHGHDSLPLAPGSYSVRRQAGASIDADGTVARDGVGWPGASRPPAPIDPGVTVSRHRALLISRG